VLPNVCKNYNGQQPSAHHNYRISDGLYLGIGVISKKKILPTFRVQGGPFFGLKTVIMRYHFLTPIPIYFSRDLCLMASLMTLSLKTVILREWTLESTFYHIYA